uniref:Uncharacterized protein n=1 Tax=Heterorhabditis bacteriophora TaxID=37862 RepID=A0A1I7WTF2_HETBA
MIEKERRRGIRDKGHIAKKSIKIMKKLAELGHSSISSSSSNDWRKDRNLMDYSEKKMREALLAMILDKRTEKRTQHKISCSDTLIVDANNLARYKFVGPTIQFAKWQNNTCVITYIYLFICLFIYLFI